MKLLETHHNGMMNSQAIERRTGIGKRKRGSHRAGWFSSFLFVVLAVVVGSSLVCRCRGKVVIDAVEQRLPFLFFPSGPPFDGDEIAGTIASGQRGG